MPCYKYAIYLAGPWFSKEQENVEEEISNLAEELEVPAFRPKAELNCPPDASVELRKRAFYGNTDGILQSRYVLARIDDYDPGTVWEMGFAYGHEIPVIAYSVAGHGLNLMLAQSCVGFLNGFEDLRDVFGSWEPRLGLFTRLPTVKEWDGGIQ